jgi:hypothetical protein
MEALIIKKTEDTPVVHLDKNEGIFEFSGKSLPEDVTSFYGPVFDWIAQYGEAPNTTTKVVFKMTYFNTASSKIILDILMKLEEIQEAGNEILIEWHYEEDDEDMQEAGEEYSEIVEVPFSFIED